MEVLERKNMGRDWKDGVTEEEWKKVRGRIRDWRGRIRKRGEEEER